MIHFLILLFSATLTLSDQAVTLDELLMVEVETHAPEGYQVDLTSLYEGLDLRKKGGTFDLVEEQHTPLADGEKITFILEPWSTGEATIGFLPVRFIAEGRPAVEKYTDLIDVAIAPSLEEIEVRDLADLLPFDERTTLALSKDNRARMEDTALAQAHAVHHQKRRHHLPWRWITLGAALALAAFGATKVMRRPKIGAAPLKIDPRAAALIALQDLEAKQLPQQQMFDQFYVRLTNIIRTYIEEAYAIKAPELTTEEFLKEVGRHPAFDSSTKAALRKFLALADLVKFARLNPSLYDCDEALSSAHTFILEG